MTNRNKSAPSNRIWTVTWISLGVVTLLIGVSMLSARQDRKSETAAAYKSDAELGAVRNIKGNQSAKVTLIELVDFQ